MSDAPWRAALFCPELSAVLSTPHARTHARTTATVSRTKTNHFQPQPRRIPRQTRAHTHTHTHAATSGCQRRGRVTDGCSHDSDLRVHVEARIIPLFLGPHVKTTICPGRLKPVCPQSASNPPPPHAVLHPRDPLDPPLDPLDLLDPNQLLDPGTCNVSRVTSASHRLLFYYYYYYLFILLWCFYISVANDDIW